MDTALRMLLVEDNPDDAELVGHEIERGGYTLFTERVDTAATLCVALDRIQWDLVIADHRLPSFSAGAALEVLKGRGLDLPFIIVSGSIDEEAAVGSLRAGAHDFVLKSNLARLLPAVERELREARIRCAHRCAAAALHESEERYRIVAENASDAIIITDEDRRIRYANPVAQRVFGAPVNELMGAPIDALLQRRRPQHSGWPSAAPVTVEKGFEARQGVELIGMHKSGKRIRLEASMGGTIQNGKWVCISILRDVTERRRAELQRERSFLEAQRARRSAERARQEAERASQAKSDFVAMISHELRTPLTAIIGYSALLTEKIAGPLTAGQTAYLARIEVTSNHLLALIDDVLTVAKADTGGMAYSISDVAVPQLLFIANAIIAPVARKKNVGVLIEPYDRSLTIRADRSRLQQVLTNLIANAVKFTLPGGRVAISCRATGVTVRIGIVDTGCGIPADQLEAIFEPFVQVNGGLTRTAGGVGLGLAISRKLVDGMDGVLSVVSTFGSGSEFSVSLPRGSHGISNAARMASATTGTSGG